VTTETTAPNAQTMYDRIGGGPSVKEAVNRFYVRLLDDPEVSAYFASTDLAKLKAHQAALISQLLGGPSEYTGRELSAAHMGMAITNAHYDIVVGHLVAVLVELGVPGDIVDALGGVVASVKSQIVTAEEA
jgi:hemoglobin